MSKPKFIWIKWQDGEWVHMKNSCWKVLEEDKEDQRWSRQLNDLPRPVTIEAAREDYGIKI